MQEILLVNPRKRGGKRRRVRRARSRSRKSRHVSRITRRFDRARRSRRRNPIGLSGVFSQLMPAFQGAAGAVATDIAYRLLPVPGPLSILKGVLAPVTRIGVALGIGALASMFGGRTLARQMTSGALVVIAYDFVNTQILSRIPVIGLPAAPVGEYISGLGYSGAGTVLTDTQNNGVGEYISGTESHYNEMEAF